jgi:transcriptional regulator with XRE-family HTH domain
MAKQFPRLSGADLQERRRDRELTQADLAAALGVRRQRISNIEALARPTASTVRRYLAALEALALAQ